MFALLRHPQHLLPALVNIESRDYLELKFAGYEEIKQGTRKNLENEEKVMIEELCLDRELDIEND